MHLGAGNLFQIFIDYKERYQTHTNNHLLRELNAASTDAMGTRPLRHVLFLRTSSSLKAPVLPSGPLRHMPFLLKTMSVY